MGIPQIWLSIDAYPPKASQDKGGICVLRERTEPPTFESPNAGDRDGTARAEFFPEKFRTRA